MKYTSEQKSKILFVAVIVLIGIIVIINTVIFIKTLIEYNLDV